MTFTSERFRNNDQFKNQDSSFLSCSYRKSIDHNNAFNSDSFTPFSYSL